MPSVTLKQPLLNFDSVSNALRENRLREDAAICIEQDSKSKTIHMKRAKMLFSRPRAPKTKQFKPRRRSSKKSRHSTVIPQSARFSSRHPTASTYGSIALQEAKQMYGFHQDWNVVPPRSAVESWAWTMNQTEEPECIPADAQPLQTMSTKQGLPSSLDQDIVDWRSFRAPDSLQNAHDVGGRFLNLCADNTRMLKARVRATTARSLRRSTPRGLANDVDMAFVYGHNVQSPAEATAPPSKPVSHPVPRRKPIKKANSVTRRVNVHPKSKAKVRQKRDHIMLPEQSAVKKVAARGLPYRMRNINYATKNLAGPMVLYADAWGQHYIHDNTAESTSLRPYHSITPAQVCFNTDPSTMGVVQALTRFDATTSHNQRAWTPRTIFSAPQ